MQQQKSSLNSESSRGTRRFHDTAVQANISAVVNDSSSQTCLPIVKIHKEMAVQTVTWHSLEHTGSQTERVVSPTVENTASQTSTNSLQQTGSQTETVFSNTLRDTASQTSTVLTHSLQATGSQTESVLSKKLQDSASQTLTLITISVQETAAQTERVFSETLKDTASQTLTQITNSLRETAAQTESVFTPQFSETAVQTSLVIVRDSDAQTVSFECKEEPVDSIDKETLNAPCDVAEEGHAAIELSFEIGSIQHYAEFDATHIEVREETVELQEETVEVTPDYNTRVTRSGRERKV